MTNTIQQTLADEMNRRYTDVPYGHRLCQGFNAGSNFVLNNPELFMREQMEGLLEWMEKEPNVFMPQYFKDFIDGYFSHLKTNKQKEDGKR